MINTNKKKYTGCRIYPEVHMIYKTIIWMCNGYYYFETDLGTKIISIPNCFYSRVGIFFYLTELCIEFIFDCNYL